MKIVITSDGPQKVQATVHRLFREPKTYTCIGVGLFAANWVSESGDVLSVLEPIYRKLNKAGVLWQLSDFPASMTVRV